MTTANGMLPSSIGTLPSSIAGEGIHGYAPSGGFSKWFWLGDILGQSNPSSSDFWTPEPIKTFWKPFPVHPYQPYSLNHPVLTGTHQPVIQVRQVSFFIDTKIRNHKIFSAKHTWSSSNVVKWKNAKCASATSDWFLSLPLLIGPNFIPISWYIQVQNHLENFSFGLFSSSDTLF